MRFRFSQDSHYIQFSVKSIKSRYNNRVAIISDKHERNKRAHYFSYLRACNQGRERFNFNKRLENFPLFIDWNKRFVRGTGSRRLVDGKERLGLAGALTIFPNSSSFYQSCFIGYSRG